MNKVIEWFARNSVAANCLLMIIIVAGLMALAKIRQEIFPETSLDMVSVSVLYPGATPEEVEQSICVRIEEAVQGIHGIKTMRSVAAENVGAVTIELERNVDASRVLDDVKSRVDAITTFPEDAKEPTVQEVLRTSQVLNVAVSGNLEERDLKKLTERIRDEISALQGVSQVRISAVRPYEVSIGVSEETLRKYSLTFDDVVQQVRKNSIDLPGGTVDTREGEILLRFIGQAFDGGAFSSIPVRTFPDGRKLTLGDVAEVDDGFAETNQASKFDGKPSGLVQVFRVGEEDALKIADTVKDYIEVSKSRLPDGVSLVVWRDNSQYLKQRRDLLLWNGLQGFILVFLSLAIFLRFRVAFWVTMGIPISFLGALWMMPGLDASINMLSLFAFILVLGMVVDDAIVVGENIHRWSRKEKNGVVAAIKATREVSTPVIFAVTTTIAAFIPLLMVSGLMGKFFRIVPLVVIPTLVFSLIESQLVLPAHLSRLPDGDDESGMIVGRWRRFQKRIANGLERFATNIYQPFLKFCLKHRYNVVAFAIGSALITVGLVASGKVKFNFFPSIESDNVVCVLTMPQGTNIEVTRQAVNQIEAAAIRLREEIDPKVEGGMFKHMMTSVGDQPYLAEMSNNGPMMGSRNFSGTNLGEVTLELISSDLRPGFSSDFVATRWRELTGTVKDATSVNFMSNLFAASADLDVQLSSSKTNDLAEAAAILKDEYANFDGVYNIADSFRVGKEELKLELLPEAELLSVSKLDLARQVRQAFYGEEIQRIQRGKDDIAVMLRFPESDRETLENLRDFRIRTPDRRAVPLLSVASLERSRGLESIQRVDRRRVVDVTANVDATKNNSNSLTSKIESDVMPGLISKFPGMRYTFEGQAKQLQEVMSDLISGFVLALVMIYVMLAIPFRSYFQPAIVMTAIPFGIVGAIWGHLIMGIDLSILSVFGLVALSGVVVNDSLVMVDFINKRVREHDSLDHAIAIAGVSRFRAIFLTSLTTFVGLFPLVIETSLQAQFLIPMAVSLGFGVVFATAISLILVPCFFMILEDVSKLIRKPLYDVKDDYDTDAPTDEPNGDL
ncbi:MAG: efflux RND transporter permease subunit [Planctomycetes bacterium]|nr:efflux RND transporter permease subunit [Planctomycetota bacterium]